MAYVRLGTTTTQSIVEFLVFDENDKQCATIYFSNSTKCYSFHNPVETEVIGKIPETMEEDLLKKLKNIAEAALEKF